MIREFLFRFHRPLWYTAVLSMLLMCGFEVSGQQAQLISSSSIYGDPTDQITFTVRYHFADQDTIGDGDIWAFGYSGGLSTPVTFLKKVNHPFWDDILEDGQIPPEDFPVGYSDVTYAIPHPDGEGALWTGDFNQRIALLLEPGEVGRLPHSHLGFLNLRIGEEKPPIKPESVHVSVNRVPIEIFDEIGLPPDGIDTGSGYVANVRVVFANPLTEYVSDWGEVTVDGNEISVTPTFGEREAPGINELPPPNYYGYHLPELESGDYRFSVKYGGEILASTGFSVSQYESVPAVVRLEPGYDENGQPILRGNIIMLNPYFVIQDTGSIELIELETDQYRGGLEINIYAERVTFIREPEVQPVPLAYTLPDLQDGPYQLVVNVNDEVKFQSVIEIPFPDPAKKPRIVSFQAEPRVITAGESVTLSWEVEGAESLSIDPGVGEVQGNSVTVTPTLPDFLPAPLLEALGFPPPDGLPSLVPRGADWAFQDSELFSDPIWTTVDFDDSDWKTGPGPLGYGDGDEATVIGFGEDEENKNMTAYFRHAFKVDDAAVSGGDPLVLSLHRDDGAVVYLNGREIMRSNMPDGEITADTPALENAANDGNGQPEVTLIDSGLLIPGQVNILAVEVHQSRPSSSDLSFDLALGNQWDFPFPWPDPTEPFEVVYTLTASNPDGVAAKRVSVLVNPVGGPVRHSAEVEIFEDNDGHAALVVVDPAPGYQIIQWGELITESLTQNTYNWKVEVTLEKYPDGEFPGPAPEPLENTYRLGKLRPGFLPLPSTFTVTDGQRIIGQATFVVDGRPDPSVVQGVSAESEPVTDPQTGSYQFKVRYERGDGIDPESLGDDDIRVVPFIEVDVAGLRLASYPARLIEYSLYDDEITVEAVYAVDFPEDFFANIREMDLEILLMDGGVVSAAGQGIAGGRIGFIPVRIGIDPPPTETSVHAEATPIHQSDEASEIHVMMESSIPLDPASLKGSSIRVARILENGEIRILGKTRLDHVDVPEKPVHHMMAFFSIMPPSDGWSERDNGSWIIELVDKGLTHVDGSAVRPARIGELFVDINDIPPGPGRVKTEIDVIETETHFGVDVNVIFPPNDRRTITDWGSPRKEDGVTYLPAVTSTRVTLDALPHRQSHRYLLFRKDGNTGGTEIPFEEVDGPPIQVFKPQQIAIQSEREWNDWVSSVVGELDIAFVPPVNFDEHTLIGVFSGEKNTGGFGIEIIRISDLGDEVLVDYLETVPGIGMPVPEVITYPAYWAAIKKHDGPFTFAGETLYLPGPAGEMPEVLPHSRPIPEGELVVFMIDGEPLVEAIVPTSGDGNPNRPEIMPSSSEISITVEEAIAAINVVADFTGSGVPVQFLGWSDLEIDGSFISLDLQVGPLESDIETPTPGAPPIFSESFEAGPLAPAHYQFLFTVNGRPVARNFFMVKGDHPFFDWLEEHLGHLDTEAGPGRNVIVHQNDADGDGLTDFYEWALVSNPLDKKNKSPIHPGVISREGKRHFTFDFNFREDSQGVTYVIEGSDDLSAWTRIEADCTVVEKHRNQDGSTHVSLCLEDAIEDIPSRFVRIRVLTE